MAAQNVPQTGPGAPGLAQTMQVRNFKGVNQTDARQAIEDLELDWLENVQPVGKGNLVILPGRGPTVATYDAPHASMTGIILNDVAYLVGILNDGSAHAIIIPGGPSTPIWPPGTFSKFCRMAMWQDQQLLFLDPVGGYRRWDGTSSIVIDAARLGNSITVFEGRAWLQRNQRTIEFTAPNTFDDFNPANGAGSFVLTDAVFPGPIVQLLSALEQLWIIGSGAIDAISNVQTTAGITTFSVTNIVTNVGTIYPSSVTSFFRTFIFANAYGVYAIVGATPQKLSDKLDSLFPRFTPTITSVPDIPAAVGTLNEVFTWMGLVGYADPALGAVRAFLICFAQGKWFFASAGSIRWITSVLVNGVPQIWASSTAEDLTTTVFQLFDAAASPPVPVDYLIRTKLYDFGLATQMKELLRVGFEFQAETGIFPEVFIENESLIVPVPFATGNILIFVGVGPISFIGAGPIVWISGGTLLPRRAVNMIGNYFGITITGTDLPWRLSAFQMQVKGAGDWN